MAQMEMLTSWALGIRTRMMNDPGRSDFEDQIQCNGFLFLDEYLEDILAGPKQQQVVSRSIIELAKTPGRKKDVPKRTRAATAAALASAKKLKSPSKPLSQEGKENIEQPPAVNKLQQALLRAREEEILKTTSSPPTTIVSNPVNDQGSVKIMGPLLPNGTPSITMSNPSPPRPSKSPLRPGVRGPLSPRGINRILEGQSVPSSPKLLFPRSVPAPFSTSYETTIPVSQPNQAKVALATDLNESHSTVESDGFVPSTLDHVAHTHFDAIVPLKEDLSSSGHNSPQPKSPRPPSPLRLPQGLSRKPSVPNFTALPAPSPIRKSMGTALGGGGVRSSWLKKARETKGFEGLKRASVFPAVVTNILKRKSGEMLGSNQPDTTARAPKVAKLANKSHEPCTNMKTTPSTQEAIIPIAQSELSAGDEEDTQHRLERLAKTISGMAPVADDQEDTQHRLERLMKTVDVMKGPSKHSDSSNPIFTEEDGSDEVFGPAKRDLQQKLATAFEMQSSNASMDLNMQDVSISTTPPNSPPSRPLPVPPTIAPGTPPVVFKPPIFRPRPSEDIKPIPSTNIFKPVPVVPSVFQFPPAVPLPPPLSTTTIFSRPGSQSQPSTQSTYLDDEHSIFDTSQHGLWPASTFSTNATSQGSQAQASQYNQDTRDAFPGWGDQAWDAPGGSDSDKDFVADMVDEPLDDDNTEDTAALQAKMSASTSSTMSKVLNGSAKGRIGLKSLQLAAAAAKREQEEKDKKAARMKEMESRRIAIQEKKQEEERIKAAEAEKRQREENEKRKREREETEKKPVKGGKTLTQVEEITKKRKVTVELKKSATENKKPPSKDKKAGKPPSIATGQSSSQPLPGSSAMNKSATFKYPGMPSSATASTFTSFSQPEPSTSSVRLVETQNSKGPLPKPPKVVFKTSLAGIQPSQVLQQQMQARVEAQMPQLQEPFPPSESIELEDINSEYSDSDDEGRVKPVRPDWTNSPELRQALELQRNRNPDDIFGPIRPLQMEEFFRTGHSRFRARSSSANWNGADRLTAHEELEYARRMGFR